MVFLGLPPRQFLQTKPGCKAHRAQSAVQLEDPAADLRHLPRRELQRYGVRDVGFFRHGKGGNMWENPVENVGTCGNNPMENVGEGGNMRENVGQIGKMWEHV